MQSAVYKSLVFTISLLTTSTIFGQGSDYIDGENSGTCNSCNPSVANDPATREFIDNNFPNSEEVLIRGHVGGNYYRWYRSGIYNTYYLDSSYGSGTGSGSGSGGGSGGGSGSGGGTVIVIIGGGGNSPPPTPCPGGVTVNPDGTVVTCHTS